MKDDTKSVVHSQRSDVAVGSGIQLHTIHDQKDILNNFVTSISINLLATFSSLQLHLLGLLEENHNFSWVNTNLTAIAPCVWCYSEDLSSFFSITGRQKGVGWVVTEEFFLSPQSQCSGPIASLDFC